MSKKYDWLKIKALYESGEAAPSISKRPGMPTKQAIYVRAKKGNWIANTICPTRVNNSLVEYGKFTGDNQVAAIGYLKSGLSRSVVAKLLGIDRKTLYNWFDKSPQFLQACEAAEAEHVAKHIQNIDQASEKDWKASDRLLQVNKLTKDDWAKTPGHAMIGNTFNVLAHVTTGIDRGKIVDL